MMQLVDRPVRHEHGGAQPPHADGGQDPGDDEANSAGDQGGEPRDKPQLHQEIT